MLTYKSQFYDQLINRICVGVRLKDLGVYAYREGGVRVLPASKY